jgi:hypothetical protein
LRIEASDSWTDEVRLDRAGFAAYLLSQSNLLGQELEPVRAWLLGELAPFFPREQTVAFTASYRRLRL